MISDTNSVIGFAYNTIVGVMGGDFLLLGLAFLLVVSLVFIVGRVRAGSALMVGLFITFVFALFVPALMALFWIILIVSVLVLVNGLRRTWSGY
jgi:hypothetical protein